MCQMGFPLCLPSAQWPRFLLTAGHHGHCQGSSSREKRNRGHPMTKVMARQLRDLCPSVCATRPARTGALLSQFFSLILISRDVQRQQH